MIRVFNKFEPVPEHFVEVDTTSRGSFKDLSPFYLGPYHWNDPLFGNMTCKRFENLWQYSKVYQEHIIYINLEGYKYTPDHPIGLHYYEWRKRGFSQDRAERYPMGKGKKPLFTLWKGQRYSYIEARKKIYIPIYSELVLKTKSYALLYDWVLQGRDIALRDFDGYDHVAKDMALHDVIDSSKSLGHAFIIYGLLTSNRAVIDLL